MSNNYKDIGALQHGATGNVNRFSIGALQPLIIDVVGETPSIAVVRAIPANHLDSFQSSVLAAATTAAKALALPAGSSLAFTIVIPPAYEQPEFTDLAVRRTVILEVTPSLTLTTWAAHPSVSDVYQAALSAWFNASLYRRVSSVRANFSVLTERADITALDAASEGYWWDEENELLNVKTATDTPVDFTMQAFVTYYFSTEGITVNRVAGDSDTGIYYQPWLTGQLPQLTRQISDVLSGVTIIPSGDVTVTNGHSAFFVLSASHTWKNKQAKFLLAEHGAEIPERDDFNEITTMLIEDLAPNEDTAIFRLTDVKRLLDKEIPPTTYSLADYPFLGEGVDGTQKWIGYGRATINPDLTDTSGLGVYTVADAAYQDLFAVHSVTAIARTNGVKTGLAGGDYSVNLTTCTITILNATYTHVNYYIECDVTGKPDSGASYLQTFAQITRDILQTHLMAPDAAIDIPSFTQADIDAPEELSVWLKEPRSIASIFSSAEDKTPSLERSVLGAIRQTADGLWNVRISFGAPPATVHALTKSDFVYFLPDVKIENIASIANVFYDYDHSEESWSVEKYESLETQYIYESFDTIKFYTFLRAETDAASLVQRVLLLASARSIEIEFKLRGSRLAHTMAGDYVTVTYSPAPTLTGEFDEQPLEISRLDLAQSPTLEITGRLTDMRSISRSTAHVTDDSAPDWASSSMVERLFNGFVTDDDGYIDPLDVTTLNKSLVW